MRTCCLIFIQPTNHIDSSKEIAGVHLLTNKDDYEASRFLLADVVRRVSSWLGKSSDLPDCCKRIV